MLTMSGGLALYAGRAHGPVILAQSMPAGSDPSHAATLNEDSVVSLVAPEIFIVGWAPVERALARS